MLAHTSFQASKVLDPNKLAAALKTHPARNSRMQHWGIHASTPPAPRSRTLHHARSPALRRSELTGPAIRRR